MGPGRGTGDEVSGGLVDDGDGIKLRAAFGEEEGGVLSFSGLGDLLTSGDARPPRGSSLP